jgi:hypothetical protein
MFKAYTLPPVTFAFRNNHGTDKFRGLQEFGPYQGAIFKGSPRFGFVFPSQYRDQANSLYRALKNGIGYFRGVESAFRLPLRTDQVFPVNFPLPHGIKPRDAARFYADAIVSWHERTNERPDMVFVLHPWTADWEEETPYYRCKAVLLQEGILSQSVTLELIDDPSRLEWSVANIALGAFVKLGGVPWIVYGEDPDQELIIGIGRTSLYDPQKGASNQVIGFTTCFSARGLFKFACLADVAQNRQEYLKMLGQVVRSSLDRAEQLGRSATSLTLHVPKEIGREEEDVIAAAVKGHTTKHLPQISIVKITDEASFFAVDEGSTEGIPPRGIVIQTSNEEYMLYTEGREERQPWRHRIPTALRIVPQGSNLGPQRIADLIRQVYDLSQVNWRGFNARSRPISVYYGSLIARILSHIHVDAVSNLYTAKARKMLEERMWFL